MFGKKREKTREEKKREFWMNSQQTLWQEGGGEVLVVRGRDIECCWTEGNGQPQFKDGKSNPEYRSSNLIRTRSGQTFRLTRESWLKCRFEDPEAS